MKTAEMIAAVGLAVTALAVPAHAEVPLGSHGTAGSDAKGIGIAVEQGILVVTVSNASGSGDWRDRIMEHNSQGFSLQMEGGVQCRSSYGISHGSLFVGDVEAQSFTPSNLPRERYFADTYFVSPAAFGEGEGTIGFDPVAVVERALADHMAKGGHPVDFLRKDHTFPVWVQPSFRAVCRKKVGMSAATGGYWNRQAVADGGVKIIVQYSGDPTLSSGRARGSTSTNGGNTQGPPARTTGSGQRRPAGIRAPDTSASEGTTMTDLSTIKTMDKSGVSEAEETRPDAQPEEAQEKPRGGFRKAATSFLGGLLRGKKPKDAAIDAVLGEEDDD